MCVHAAIVDAARRAGPRPAELPAELREAGVSEEEAAAAAAVDGAELPEEGYLRQESAARLWELVRARLADEKEVVVVHALFVLGLKPAAIQARWRERFPDTREIYRIRQNVLERLARDPTLRELADDRA